MNPGRRRMGEGISGGKAREITVVSGLPRSGTSMMMQMLEAGGMEVLTDRLRAADEDNLKGYYEFEKVKELKHDPSWLDEGRGRVVKIVSELLKYLPAEYPYKIIFMKRKMEEVLASQHQMLIRRGAVSAGPVGEEKMAGIFQKHLRGVEAWLARQPNMNVFYADYNKILEHPEHWVERINRFLEHRLDSKGMVGGVEPALYRQRR